MEEGKQQNDTRYFLIEHKKCKAIFTIDSKKIIASYKNDDEFKCPNCHKSIIEDDGSFKSHFRGSYRGKIPDLLAFKGFLRMYDDLKKWLGGSSIREIQFEDLEAMKSPSKPSK